MGLDIGGVYVVRFPNRGMNEFYGKHYGVVLSKISKDDSTLLVAPITGKKSGHKYRGGITLDNFKYQTEPSYDSSFVYARKIQEIDKRRILSERKLKRDNNGDVILDKNGNELYYRKYTKAYQLDDEDLEKLRCKIEEIIKLKNC
jgi:hypothetical protein